MNIIKTDIVDTTDLSLSLSLMKLTDTYDSPSNTNSSDVNTNTNINSDINNISIALDTNFKKCVKGYHLINSSPIIEKIWEDINANLFTSVGIDVISKSNGSHAPGMDIQCALGGISNKSGKYSNDKKSINNSSYR